MVSKWLARLCACVLVFVAVAIAQDAPANGQASQEQSKPVLSEVNRLKLVNASQSVEIWQLKLQQAAAEFSKARGEFDRVLSSLQVQGWELKLDTLEYVKKAAAK